MRVCIVGASGKLGHYLVQHSLDRGYEVVGVCREQSVPKLDAFQGRMTIVPGATDDPEVIKRAVAGCDGVLVVLVPRGVHGYSTGTAQAVLDHAPPGSSCRDCVRRLACVQRTFGGRAKCLPLRAVGPATGVVRSQAWRRTGQLTGQLSWSPRVVPRGGRSAAFMRCRHTDVASRDVSRHLCKPEVAGSIPARSMAQPSCLCRTGAGSEVRRAL